MKKEKLFGNILFWLTLISPMVSFSLAGAIGEANIFGVAGIVRYSWVMWLFIPVGVLSIIIGLKLKKSNQKYKKNFVIAFVCLSLLVIFGSYRFVFNNVSYDVSKASIVEDKIDLELPDEIKIATIKLDSYNISYVKIVNEESKETFEQGLETNQLWQHKLSPEIESLLPLDIQYEAEIFDFFVLYNITSYKCNVYPSKGDHECAFVAYDYEAQRLIILDNYKVNIN